MSKALKDRYSPLDVICKYHLVCIHPPPSDGQAMAAVSSPKIMCHFLEANAWATLIHTLALH